MISKKNAVAAGVGLLYAVTMVVCSCCARQPSDEHNPTVSGGSVIKNNVGGIKDDTETASSGESSENMSTSSSESTDIISVPDSDGFSDVPKKPKFDDPDSYLRYDISTDRYMLAPNELAIGQKSLFVGDSICYGFSAWNVLPGANVYATGCVAARNMLEYEMYYRNERMEFVPVLDIVKPEHIFLWMGMNDVNMTSAREYCENYSNIISLALENSEADVYVCAITPISNLNFTAPSNITKFNEAITDYIDENYSERVHFISFAEPLKDKNGHLTEQYNGGDGIHLSKKVYYIAMHEIAKEIDPDGLLVPNIPDKEMGYYIGLDTEETDDMLISEISSQ